MQETLIQSLGREDPLEKEMATHSSILAWKILWTEKSGGLQSMGSQELDTTEQVLLCASLIAQLVKNMPAVQETLIQFLGWEDPLEKGYATHSSIPGLPWWLSW